MMGDVIQFSDERWRNELKMKGKEIAQIAHNARVLLTHHAHYKGCFRWNRVALRVEIFSEDLFVKLRVENNIDEIVSAVQDHLAAVHELNLGRDDIGRRIVSVAMDNGFDPIQDWLTSLKWDGIPRLDDWLITYAGAKRTPDDYVTFIGRKWLLSAVARAFVPGCKADIVLVAEGLQGTYKSTLFSILGGPWFAETQGVLGDKDSKQLIGTAWIVELPDMAAFSKTDRNAMKAFITIQIDRYRPPYAKAPIEVKRRAVLAATTNEEEYFTDPTGNRRFAPVLFGDINPSALLRDRDQLFAEAVHLYLAAEHCTACRANPQILPNEPPRCPVHAWWLTPAEKFIAKGHAKTREEHDAWSPAIMRFAAEPRKTLESGSPTNELVPLTTGNILVYALKFNLKDIEKRDEMRVAAIMKQHDFTRTARGAEAIWTPRDQATAPKT